MTSERLQLIDQIRNAFAGVVLEDGIGLKQAEGFDAYKDDWTCAQYRASDETKDWARISPNDLTQCQSGLSYFDSKGMRFHLPAFLIAELEETISVSLELYLIDLDDYNLAQFELLSIEQKRAVESFLWVILKDEKFKHRHEEISTALENYWMR